jgi:hypothetical protein
MSKSLVKVTAAEVAQAMAANPYRTVRLGTVSIREAGGRYSVRAPRTAVRQGSGKYVTGERQTVIYGTQAEVAAVVSAQAHGQSALASGHGHRHHKALTSH